MGNNTEYDTWWPILSNKLALEIQGNWAGLAGRLVSSGPGFTTVVPHGASCEDMKDTRTLPSWSVWGKPLTRGRFAITAVNSLLNASAAIAVDLSELGLGGPGGKAAVSVTEVWSGDRRKLAAGATQWTVTLPPQGHAFVILQKE
jgi:hypothetical protein